MEKAKGKGIRNMDKLKNLQKQNRKLKGDSTKTYNSPKRISAAVFVLWNIIFHFEIRSAILKLDNDNN